MGRYNSMQNNNVEYLLDIKQGYAIVNNKKIGIKLLKAFYIVITIIALIRTIPILFSLFSALMLLIAKEGFDSIFSTLPGTESFMLMISVCLVIIDIGVVFNKYTKKGYDYVSLHFAFLMALAFISGVNYAPNVLDYQDVASYFLYAGLGGLISVFLISVYTVPMMLYLSKRKAVFRDENEKGSDKTGAMMNMINPAQRALINEEHAKALELCQSVKWSVVEHCCEHRGERIFLDTYLNRRVEDGSISNEQKNLLFDLFNKPLYFQQQIDNAPGYIISKCRGFCRDKDKIEKYLNKQFDKIERYNLEIIRNYFCYDASGLLKDPDPSIIITNTEPVNQEQETAINSDQSTFSDDVIVNEPTDTEEKTEQRTPVNHFINDCAGLTSNKTKKENASSGKCPECGATLIKGAQFCNKCGARIIKDKAFCRKCGTELFDDSEFCHKCGTEVKGR